MQLNEIIQILEHIGAFKVNHSGRSLGDHLLNTMELLYHKNASEEVCIAAALHSVYGTNAFKNNVIDYSHREKYQKVLGEYVENLIYLFSIVNRPFDIETGILTNYRTGERIEVDLQTISELRQIEAANLIEQKCSILRFPNILATWNSLKHIRS